ncbi:MAG: CYTH domain-containing protein [Bacteroidaceae bacterium]|nr:CYTH domain-containing protein [Bacteroidaceae bacterium]
MAFEIERKFLVQGDFKSQSYQNFHILQGYIFSGGGKTVRIRIRDDKGFITIKGPSDNGGLSRYEWEKEIPLDEARDLMKLCEPGIIEKTRYLIKSGKHIFEVDEFYGDNAGLIMAEVELSSEDEEFDIPDFIGREVTGDRRFYNGSLRRCPFSVWKQSFLQET